VSDGRIWKWPVQLSSRSLPAQDARQMAATRDEHRGLSDRRLVLRWFGSGGGARGSRRHDPNIGIAPPDRGSLKGVTARIEVELLWWEGCPSSDHACGLVRTALDELGLDGVGIEMVEIETDAQASERGFRGSPTILINGIDLIELAGGEDAGDDQIGALSCRLYHRRDGRVSPTPDPADVHAAFAIALERAATEELA